MDEVFYVQLDNAKDFRKNSLEATRLVIQTLQGAERIKRIRQEKTDAFQELASVMQDIDKLCEDMRILPPPLDISTRPEKADKLKKGPNLQAAELADAISQVENKLKRLR